jgi:BlaI family penicillinase repressor
MRPSRIDGGSQGAAPRASSDMEPIGPLQVRVMAFIWSHGPSTVHDVHDAVNTGRGKPLAYTTILTVMRNLVRRGLLAQTVCGRAHVFTAAVDERSYKVALLRHLRELHFAGDAVLMAHHLAADDQLPPAIRERLAAIRHD